MVRAGAGGGGEDQRPAGGAAADGGRGPAGAADDRPRAGTAPQQRRRSPGRAHVTAVGFLGLGAIGWPMAARLAARDHLVVWNRTAARAEEFTRQYGARAAATPRELAAAVDVAVTCLPTSADVAALLEGPDGLLAGLQPGALLLDCTSGDPGTS
ncbi:MAG TPA: NAD(P)-binding domain-containing protein, partial [Gemmatimonadales bacterium]|nr:NAD(P)-binding domain-containing protein [Gemmatimonadales bacterium]